MSSLSAHVMTSETLHFKMMDAIAVLFQCKFYNQRTNGPVNAHLSMLHIPINMFEYYGI